jgi:Transcriptional regulators
MTAPRASRSSSSAPRGRSRAAVPAEADASDVLVALFNSVGELHDTLERIYRPARLNKQKFIVLTALARQAPAPALATQLAEIAGVTRASMTTLLDALERSGWIERRRDARDRRAIQIHITDAGRALVESPRDSDPHHRCRARARRRRRRAFPRCLRAPYPKNGYNPARPSRPPLRNARERRTRTVALRAAFSRARQSLSRSLSAPAPWAGRRR